MMDEFEAYKSAVHAEMKRLGATDAEIKAWATDKVIATAIKNKREPECIAWALVQ